MIYLKLPHQLKIEQVKKAARRVILDDCVSEHVTIGSAARQGKDLGSWFVLCRES